MASVFQLTDVTLCRFIITGVYFWRPSLLLLFSDQIAKSEKRKKERREGREEEKEEEEKEEEEYIHTYMHACMHAYIHTYNKNICIKIFLKN